MPNDFRFLMYNSTDEDVSVNAVVKDESIWLSQKGMAELFSVEVPAISKHLSIIHAGGITTKRNCFPNGNSSSKRDSLCSQAS